MNDSERAVRVATRNDTKAIGLTHTNAFRDDPVWTWLLPHDWQWKNGTPYVMRCSVREHVDDGTIWILPDSVVGVSAAAVWARPGFKQNRLMEIRSALPLAVLFGKQARNGLKMLAALQERRPQEPHWHLEVLGTDPAHQGKGHGTRVLEPTLARCDQDGIGASLDSSKESNVPYYERFGFRVQQEFTPVAGGPSLWAMWRAPQ